MTLEMIGKAIFTQSGTINFKFTIHGIIPI